MIRCFMYDLWAFAKLVCVLELLGLINWGLLAILPAIAWFILTIIFPEKWILE